MNDAIDRMPSRDGYKFRTVSGEQMHVWPFGPTAGLVVIERDGEPVSAIQTSAAVVPLTDKNATFLAEMWKRLLSVWRRLN